MSTTNIVMVRTVEFPTHGVTLERDKCYDVPKPCADFLICVGSAERSDCVLEKFKRRSGLGGMEEFGL